MNNNTSNTIRIIILINVEQHPTERQVVKTRKPDTCSVLQSFVFANVYKHTTATHTTTQKQQNLFLLAHVPYYMLWQQTTYETTNFDQECKRVSHVFGCLYLLYYIIVCEMRVQRNSNSNYNDASKSNIQRHIFISIRMDLITHGFSSLKLVQFVCVCVCDMRVHGLHVMVCDDRLADHTYYGTI